MSDFGLVRCVGATTTRGVGTSFFKDPDTRNAPYEPRHDVFSLGKGREKETEKREKEKREERERKRKERVRVYMYAR